MEGGTLLLCLMHSCCCCCCCCIFPPRKAFAYDNSCTTITAVLRGRLFPLLLVRARACRFRPEAECFVVCKRLNFVLGGCTDSCRCVYARSYPRHATTGPHAPRKMLHTACLALLAACLVCSAALTQQRPHISTESKTHTFKISSLS